MTSAVTYQRPTFEAVIQTIDEGLERLPSYMDLYHKWERQQWAVQDCDFTIDRQQWAADAPKMLRKNRMASYVGFFAGEIEVTDTLAPYIAAMPRLDQRIFLTTQLVDEARHVAFFDKWFREVLGDAQMDDIYERRAQHGNYIFKKLLPEISNGLRQHPENMNLLVDGVTLYHIYIESALALAGQTRILNAYKQANIFPGFQEGFTNVARDESRHVLFGVKFLHDMVQSDEKYAYRVVDFINNLLPMLYESTVPEPDMMRWMLQTGQDLDWRNRFFASAFRRKFRAIGIQADVPDPASIPIPTEMQAMLSHN